ncbi:MAG: hypothetical protein HDS69_09825 [Bacteroidales bacterium]|nr:hypothetical protein [Bacteroidales bacterium]
MTSKDNGIFNVNLKRLALLTLPTWLRRPLVGALVYAGVTPLGRLLQELRSYRNTTRYRLRHNGQVCKLRGVLNDEFDPELRRIVIEDLDSMENREASTVWQREAERWVMVPQRGTGAVSIHREGFSGTSGYDFWVTLPEELRDVETETRLRAIVNMYKLASKRYAINYK